MCPNAGKLREDLLEVGHWWVDAACRGGGTLQVWRVGDDVTGASLVYDTAFPRQFVSSVAMSTAEYRRKTDADLQALEFPPTRRSAIVETIYRVCLALRPLGGRKVLVVMSDLREVNERWDFERHIPATPEFLGWMEATGLDLDLQDFDVYISGLDFRPAGRDTRPLTPIQYRQLGDLWRHVFAECGAATIGIADRFLAPDIGS